MKIFIYIFVFFLSQKGFCQQINPLGFEIIKNDVYADVFQIKHSDQVLSLIEKFNLEKNDAITLGRIVEKIDFYFFQSEELPNYIIPYFTFSEHPNQLNLTIYCLSVVPKRENEEFVRGKYHFILSTSAEVNNFKAVYKNSKLIMEEGAINEWFIDLMNKKYATITKPIFDKYGLTPPPPPLPPSSL